ncbi:MAG: MotA/TolQ/ExbB proton channel family protein [Candidatus Marinimicrobia bacterium]|nr:MotA/TolQ/ExbB proton channel family protein [Candidatus Neomarinimicrobiota bacterium]MDD9887235.1 MotA/TolQ/ExbB proton channel family protein [Candidatus Neomarinimicrobiota bacterium]MDD9930854.1 MotA/TolQ/ExbB proton channel family protein [Candidatus Neomarinimicrobiota bacterium]
MVQYFIDGGAFMWPILISLVFGLGFALERAYSLVMSSINSQKFYTDIAETLETNGVDAALELCNETRGPVAEIFHAGLSRLHRGVDDVEKAVQNAGSLEMSFLEKNMIWLNTVITVAPMIGFTGTVVGMIAAFDAIKAANDISPAVVAGGISQALLTTAFGLITAMIIQFFQNFFVSRIDKLILDMEENSIKLVDQLHDMDATKKSKK